MYFELNDRGQALAEYQKVVAGALYDNLTERAYLRIGGIRLLRDEYEDAIPAYQTVASNTKDPMVRRAARFGCGRLLHAHAPIRPGYSDTGADRA